MRARGKLRSIAEGFSNALRGRRSGKLRRAGPLAGGAADCRLAAPRCQLWPLQDALLDKPAQRWLAAPRVGATTCHMVIQQLCQ